jgi:glycosyltransferase involved in cell wall biosynthesis
VTVVVAVYNTMPYLERCLSSLAEQSIGHDRLEVVAVDDGSTDGSGEVLDRYAARYPSVFTVIHQENSGGPAAPSNRALDVAGGRYVYFLGADDHLAPEALERMVAFADEHGSDVVVGRMEGVNGRFVARGLFGSDQADVDLYGPHLRWQLSNTKLFNRELIEKLGLRYREDMAFGSDQPFTLTACVHARRISVLSSYTCYYAVKREDSSNMSYRTPYVDRLGCIREMMRAVADLVPAGRPRDTLLTRHFAWEIPRLLRPELLERPVAEQREVCAAVRAIADEWLNDAILDSLSVSSRVRLSAAVREDVDLLAAVVRDDADERLPVHLDGGEAFARYSGFRSSDLPDSLFRLAPGGVTQRLSAGVRVNAVAWSRSALVLDLDVPLVGPDAGSALSVSLRRLDGEGHDGQPRASVTSRAGESGCSVRVTIGRASLAAAGPATWQVRLGGALRDGRRYDVRLPAPQAFERADVHAWHRGRRYRLAATSTPDGTALAVTVERAGGILPPR